MSFIRPELAAGLRLWRESILWAATLALGLWLVWRGYARLAPLGFTLGLLLTATGTGLLRGALRRARLARAEPGIGVVTVDEARIGYFGPLGGGFADLPALTAVEIIQAPAPAWRLTSEDGSRLVIPMGAAGADRLADALSALPGIDLDRALATGGHPRATLWRRTATKRHAPACLLPGADQ